jgi:hypothetical protein
LKSQPFGLANDGHLSDCAQQLPRTLEEASSRKSGIDPLRRVASAAKTGRIGRAASNRSPPAGVVTIAGCVNKGHGPAAPAENVEALVSQIGALTRQVPVLMIFEDAHWTDPTSLEAFRRTVDAQRQQADFRS